MDINDPKTAKIFMVSVCVAGLLYLYFGTTFLPFAYRVQAKEISQLTGEYEKLSLEINRARQSAKNLPHLEAEYEALQMKWDEANQLLPNEKQIASLLREISFRGQTCGVEFVLFQPQPPVAGSFYTENPVEIKVDGGYHEIAAFLNEIATMTRIVNVRDLEIIQKPDLVGSRHIARAHFVAVAYTLGVSAQAAAGGEGGAPGGVVNTGKRIAQRVKGTAHGGTGE